MVVKKRRPSVDRKTAKHRSNRKAPQSQQQPQQQQQRTDKLQQKRPSVASERIIHDEEFGEEDVELVDSEWADFERFFR